MDQAVQKPRRKQGRPRIVGEGGERLTVRLDPADLGVVDQRVAEGNTRAGTLRDVLHRYEAMVQAGTARQRGRRPGWRGSAVSTNAGLSP